MFGPAKAQHDLVVFAMGKGQDAAALIYKGRPQAAGADVDGKVEIAHGGVRILLQVMEGAGARIWGATGP